MSRMRALFTLLVVAFALSTVACADATGPRHGCSDINNSNTCRNSRRSDGTIPFRLPAKQCQFLYS